MHPSGGVHGYLEPLHCALAEPRTREGAHSLDRRLAVLQRNGSHCHSKALFEGTQIPPLRCVVYEIIPLRELKEI